MSNPLSRRAMLRGFGAAIALPSLEAMAASPAWAARGSVAGPSRMAFLFVPNGMNMEHWTPGGLARVGRETAERLDVLPSILEPLSGVKSKMQVLSGLAQHNGFALGDGPGDHARSAASWLTGVHPKKTAGADIRNGISVDQVAASRLAGKTRFGSIELGCERGGVAGDCDSGYSCAYSSCVSWRSETTPVAKEVNPRLVFERLFGTPDGNAESLRLRTQQRRSILDFVLEDASNLRSKLSGKDKQKVEEYLESLRDVEKRVAAFELANPAGLVPSGQVPKGVPGDYSDHIRLMGDMMILAFQTDSTRVATFMFANEGSNRSYRSVGVPDGHHDMSHHSGDPAKLEAKRKIDQFHVQQLAYILNRMDSIKESNGTMLDNTMLVYGGGIGDGNRHNHDDLPILVAGGGNLGLKGGRHVRYPSNTPMNNLFLSMLDRLGIPVETLGDSTGKLQGLF